MVSKADLRESNLVGKVNDALGNLGQGKIHELDTLVSDGVGLARDKRRNEGGEILDDARDDRDIARLDRVLDDDVHERDHLLAVVEHVLQAAGVVDVLIDNVVVARAGDNVTHERENVLVRRRVDRRLRQRQVHLHTRPVEAQRFQRDNVAARVDGCKGVDRRVNELANDIINVYATI